MCGPKMRKDDDVVDVIILNRFLQNLPERFKFLIVLVSKANKLLTNRSAFSLALRCHLDSLLWRTVVPQDPFSPFRHQIIGCWST